LYNRKEIIKYVLFFDSFDCHKESVIITGARFWIYKLKATIKVVKIDRLMPYHYRLRRELFSQSACFPQEFLKFPEDTFSRNDSI